MLKYDLKNEIKNLKIANKELNKVKKSYKLKFNIEFYSVFIVSVLSGILINNLLNTSVWSTILLVGLIILSLIIFMTTKEYFGEIKFKETNKKDLLLPINNYISLKPEQKENIINIEEKLTKTAKFLLQENSFVNNILKSYKDMFFINIDIEKLNIKELIEFKLRTPIYIKRENCLEYTETELFNEEFDKLIIEYELYDLYIENILLIISKEKFKTEKENIILKIKSNFDIKDQKKYIEKILEITKIYYKEDNVEKEIENSINELKKYDEGYKIIEELKDKKVIINL
jgi:F0F1-type ATP synthase assembly protein I